MEGRWLRAKEFMHWNSRKAQKLEAPNTFKGMPMLRIENKGSV